MDTKNLKTLLLHVRPVCVTCSAYATNTDAGRPATRVAHMPDKGSCNKWYFCDKHDFTSLDSNGRGFDIESFKEEYSVPWPPPHILEDLSHAEAVRLALTEVYDSPERTIVLPLSAEPREWAKAFQEAVEAACAGTAYVPNPDYSVDFQFKTASGAYWGGASPLSGYGPDVFTLGKYDALERAFQTRRMYLYRQAGKSIRMSWDRDLEADGFERPTVAEITFRLRKREGA